MPPLHTTLVEVHREYARTNKVAKDMAEACKRGTMAIDCLAYSMLDITEGQ